MISVWNFYPEIKSMSSSLMKSINIFNIFYHFEPIFNLQLGL